jgi:hypothetical protein
MAYELRPAERSEGLLFYGTDSEGEQRHGAIGYMRADFGRNGKEFWTTWFDVQRHLKIPAFKSEFDDVINSLRNDGDKPPLASRANLEAYLANHTATPLTNHALGLMIGTLNYTYTFRCAPRPGDYDVYVRSFDNRWLLPELAGEHELPQYCYSLLPSSGELIRIQRGESGYHLCNAAGMPPGLARFKADDQNELRHITKRQEAAMLGGLLFGWDTPAAKPWNYDLNGEPRPLTKTKNEPERG